MTPINCFSGFFDIIGFRALRESLGTAGLHKAFRSGIMPSIQHSAAGRGRSAQVDGETVYLPQFGEGSVSYRAISDSVIFFTRDDSFNSFIDIVNSSFMLLQFGFGGEKAPYRGGIGWGDLIDDPVGILVGSAIEDAICGESSQAWAGCMLTQSRSDFVVSKDYIEQYRNAHLKVAEKLDDEIKRDSTLANARRLVMYSVPIQRNPKDGPVIYATESAYVIDWTIRMYEGAAEMSFAPSHNAHANEIAKNTIAFEHWARANNR